MRKYLILAGLLIFVPIAKADFQVLQSVNLDAASGENNLRSSVMDSDNGYAYFGTGDPNTRSSIVRLKISDLSKDSLLLGYSDFVPTTGVIDKQGGFIYFGTGQGTVIKIRLSDFTFVNSMQLSSPQITTSFIDSARGFIYFVNADGIVTRIRLSDFSFDQQLLLGQYNLGIYVTGVADADYAYLGTHTSNIVKIQLSDMTFVQKTSAGQPYIQTSVIDAPNGFAYFGKSGTPAAVIKVRLSDLTVQGTLVTTGGTNDIRSSVINTKSGLAYFGSFGAPYHIAKIKLSDFSLVDQIDSGLTNLNTAVLDEGTGVALFGTFESPAARVVKVDITGVAPQQGQLQFSADTFMGGENTGAATITVNRVNGSDGVVSATYESADGSAIAGNDYEAVSPASNLLTFQDGETSKTFQINLLDDNITEGFESFTLILKNPTGGATLGSPSQSLFTIVDDELPQDVLSISDPDKTFNPDNNELLEIDYALVAATPITLKVQNGAGLIKTLMQGNLGAGQYHLTWDGREDLNQLVPAGPYTIMLQTDRLSQSVDFAVKRLAPALALGTDTFEKFPNKIDPRQGNMDIKIGLSQVNHVKLIVTDLQGSLVRNLIDQTMPAGAGQTISWDGKNDKGEVVVPDIYLLILKIGGKTEIKKVAISN